MPSYAEKHHPLSTPRPESEDRPDTYLVGQPPVPPGGWLATQNHISVGQLGRKVLRSL